MNLKKSKHLLFVIALITFCFPIFCSKLNIVGGGMIGGMEAYYAFLDSKKNNYNLQITIYEKNLSIADTTISNIVPSLTCDEIISVVPRGEELVKKLNILFSQPGGIRVDDVKGVNDSQISKHFVNEAQNYSQDEVGHSQRTKDLLSLGKMSMDLWYDIYKNADSEFKEILKQSNFNPCKEPSTDDKKLHDGYRIDLIYNVADAQERANSMKKAYEDLGYKHCTILTPQEVIDIDPFLKDFCLNNSINNVWNNTAVALWRPGGCIDAQVFLPKLYEYLKKAMGTYTNEEGKQESCFQIHYGKKITGIEFGKDNSDNTIIKALKFEDGQTVLNDNNESQYVFCPGEAVGTLKKLGFQEPAYSGFAGVSLLLNIDIPEDKIEEYSKFNHCMEVHQEGIILAWQARFRNNKIFIGVAGTKAFYADQKPSIDQEFAKNRNLLQLNMVNDVLPEFISLAVGYDTKGKTLTKKDLNLLVSKKIAKRWAGVRAVVYDGFPTLGYLYAQDAKVINARCTTHLGSGGGSFAPACVIMSRNAMLDANDSFAQNILKFGSSSRNSNSNN